MLKSTYMEVGISHWGLRRPTTARVLVQQVAKDVQQEQDRYDVHVGEKALKCKNKLKIVSS